MLIASDEPEIASILTALVIHVHARGQPPHRSFWVSRGLGHAKTYSSRRKTSCCILNHLPGFPGGSNDEESACLMGDPVQALGREDPLEEEMATHSSILAWRIPWAEEPGGLQSMGSQRVGHDWAHEPPTLGKEGPVLFKLFVLLFFFKLFVLKKSVLKHGVHKVYCYSLLVLSPTSISHHVPTCNY